MASPTASRSPPQPRRRLFDRVIAQNHGKRPRPIRTQSEANNDEQEELDMSRPLAHTRHKSIATSSKLAKLSVTPTSSPRHPHSPASPLEPSPGSPRRSIESYREHRRTASMLQAERTDEEGSDDSVGELLYFDFTKIDYELDRARRLGTGLWSEVFLCEPTAAGSKPKTHDTRRPSLFTSAAVFAVKTPVRRDAIPVLKHEATVLSHIQSFSGANQYAVSFFGLDTRNSALVFEAVLGGSLDDLIGRLRHMTELSRHQELVSIFAGLVVDLVSGLAFLHDADIVHADIKPLNILLDVSDHYSLPAPVIRARYIDFSASFISSGDDDNVPATAGGGTWDYMAPEQIKSRAQPSFASDIWSLGITLLSIVLLVSPYKAACGANAFMLREAVKSGDPLGFARMDPTGKERMAACQEYIDWLKLALTKDAQKRVTAANWKRYIDVRMD